MKSDPAADPRWDFGILRSLRKQFKWSIADLSERPAGCLTWNGPYCQNPPSISVVYRRISADSYELYQEIDGKRISEDTEL